MMLMTMSANRSCVF